MSQNLVSTYVNVEQAIEELKSGNPIIITDDSDRENEGDLVCPVSLLNPNIINFMIKYCGGMICVTITENQAKKFQLSIIEKRNVNKNMANFTLPIEASEGVKTGISAKDRCHSIKTLVDNNSKYEDIAIPGHIMPIVIEKKGLQKRKGHTEGSASLSQLSNLGANNTICEILDEEGNSSSGTRLINFAQLHKLKIITIKDINQYIQNNNIDLKF